MVDSGKKFVVDEGGNKRQAINSDDIKQALNDLTQWFKSNAAVYYTLSLEGNKGISDCEADSLLKQFGAEGSTALKTLLTTIDGGF